MRFPQSVGIVGKGDFGAFIADQFRLHAPNLTIKQYDKFKPSTHTLKDVVTCDVVILAVAIEAFEQALRDIVPHLRKDAIVVDVCTVKMSTHKLLQQYLPKQPRIEMHPLFGRQSWEGNGRSLHGLQIAVCHHTLPYGVLKFVSRELSQLGLDVVEMTPEQHDRDVMAAEQFLTQYGGRLIQQAEFGLNGKNVHTLSARYFFRAMNIVGGDEGLFWAAYDANPFCEEVAERFERAVLAMREKRLARKRKSA